MFDFFVLLCVQCLWSQSDGIIIINAAGIIMMINGVSTCSKSVMTVTGQADSSVNLCGGRSCSTIILCPAAVSTTIAVYVTHATCTVPLLLLTC